MPDPAVQAEADAADRAHAVHDAAVAAAATPLVVMAADLLKAVALLNGGAGAATLVFAAVAIHDRPALSRALVGPLALFGFGLAVGCFATGWSYLAQERQARALTLREVSRERPFVRATAVSRAAESEAERFRGLAMRALFVSIGSAVAGFGAAGIILLVGLG